MNKMMIVVSLSLLAGIVFTAWCFWRILPFPPVWKWISVSVYILSFLIVFPHYMLGDRMPIGLAAVTYEIGTSWMIFFAYALFIFLVLWSGRILHIVPAGLLRDSWTGTAVVLGLLAAILVYGNIHYHHKYREELDIVTDKPLERPLTIVLASDLHVGYHNRKAELQRWVSLFNAEKPDLVLFAGDIIDGSMRPVREWHYEEEFRNIGAPVFACLGNHEYISGRDGSERFYSDAGIRLLKDGSEVVDGIRIVGRDDRSNRSRAGLPDLVVADSLFTILLDHQPFHLEEAEEAGIDFQFSGHTHNGQIWPGNWIAHVLYEKAFGSHRRGATRYYISSGLGIWGGKFRIGTRSEYVVLKLHNQSITSPS